ncbi:hypothetical protein [Stenotrophomonas tumulicola]|uniref:Uncharacterized protein n=1 Tax=Stenotrophomonas tumulicola TaxID=1685415 RepID=A0A7W3IG44_9GAMM|nr:hypothetical protein [Stenotrophomonas tumulicola]MBA8680525.1 hypothetical protein [Stenotrophomonas tumulicola]
MSKVKLQDSLGRVVNIDGSATKGATVGVNLYGPDGKTLVPASALGFGADQSAPRVSWDQIGNLPGNIKILAGMTGLGFPVRVGPNDWRQRTLQAGGGIRVTNGNGRDGDPVFTLAKVEDSGDGQDLVKVTIDAYGRVIATASATTSDLVEGSNLYFTDPRADARVEAGIANHVAEADPHPQYTTESEAAAAAPVQSVVGKQGDVTASHIAGALGLGTAATADATDFIAAASLAALPDAVDDAAAATAGVVVGGMYRNGSTLCVRIS